jgi:hypothetical protein
MASFLVHLIQVMLMIDLLLLSEHGTSLFCEMKVFSYQDRHDHIRLHKPKSLFLTQPRCYSDLRDVAKAMINAAILNPRDDSQGTIEPLPLSSNTSPSRYLCCTSHLLDSQFIEKSLKAVLVHREEVESQVNASVDIQPVCSFPVASFITFRGRQSEIFNGQCSICR